MNYYNVYTLHSMWTSSISPASFHHIVLNFMLFNIFFTAGPVWKTRDSSEQIPLQDYFTAAFNEVEPTEKYKFLSIYVPYHKKKKLYASLVFKTLKIQLYDSSIDIVRLASKDRKILSWFVTLLKKKSKNIVWRNQKGQTFNTCVKNWNQAE